MRIGLAVFLMCSLFLASCGAHLFSSANPEPDRSRPVVLIEVRGGGPILGATTTEGIVFLADEKISGPCRVHYFLGPDLIVEDGVIGTLGGVYATAEIDLKTQAVSVMTRDVQPDDELIALVLSDNDVDHVSVELAGNELVTGYALQWPGRELPAGTGIFRVRTGRHSGRLQFVGLANGLATLNAGGTAARFITFTGPARMREALATPKPLFKKHEIKHRPDDISVRK